MTVDETSAGPIPNLNPNSAPNPVPIFPLDQNAGSKRKRNLAGKPDHSRSLIAGEDPGVELIALSPRALLSGASTFACELCGREFRRAQNLQIHRRGHNLPWNFRAKPQPDPAAAAVAPRKRAYVCPEPSCVHHDPSRALGDLTGIKKHYGRKHGEKKWTCDNCSRRYAVRSDWKAHARVCSNREYECSCGTLFSRKDSCIIHRASCMTTGEESDGGATATADFNIKVNTVNNELLFPSLWGRSSWQPEPENNQ